ncbi:MAG TPA: hypothetical protein VFR17_01150 [Mycobacterium sp.]|nr:hypothetical protein [Mycobacterium sp.]
MTRLFAPAILAAASLMLAAAAGAAPGGDSFQGVCQILAESGGDYELAVMSVESDAGLSRRDSIRFVRKAIQDHCPTFRDIVGD